MFRAIQKTRIIQRRCNKSPPIPKSQYKAKACKVEFTVVWVSSWKAYHFSYYIGYNPQISSASMHEVGHIECKRNFWHIRQHDMRKTVLAHMICKGHRTVLLAQKQTKSSRIHHFGTSPWSGIPVPNRNGRICQTSCVWSLCRKPEPRSSGEWAPAARNSPLQSLPFNTWD